MHQESEDPMYVTFLKSSGFMDFKYAEKDDLIFHSNWPAFPKFPVRQPPPNQTQVDRQLMSASLSLIASFSH